MEFYRDLYVGESLIKKQNKVVRKLSRNIGQLSIYVITLAEGKDLLEIYHCGILKQKYLKKVSPFIVGIAKGYDEAIELMQVIVNDTFDATGNYQVKDYIMKQQNKAK